jgi:branched-chain amino acid transport system substrate-binding protein
MQRDAGTVIEAQGGRVLGAARHPIGASDFAAYLLQAQASGAQAVGLASVGGDLINLIKQAAEFGLLRPGGPAIVAFLTYITDVHALGLPIAQGLMFSAGFYWDQNAPARAWAKRFFAARHAMPTKNQAAIYASVSHYLRAMQQAGSADSNAVNRAMRAMPVDFFGHPARLREDGRLLYDLTLYRVKTPAESHAPWSYYTRLRDIPADVAFLPANPACLA